MVSASFVFSILVLFYVSSSFRLAMPFSYETRAHMPKLKNSSGQVHTICSNINEQRAVGSDKKALPKVFVSYSSGDESWLNDIVQMQLGVLSPTKLRMKILGAQKGLRKGGSNSSRQSPSKTEELEYSKNILLDVDHQEASYKDSDGDLDSAEKEVSKFRQNQTQASERKSDTSNAKQHVSKNFPYQPHSASNLSMIHPLRTVDEGTNFHDTANNTSTSFEFHQGMRATQQGLLGPLTRQVPSKWNDAEKWIVNRQITNAGVMKKSVEINQGNRSIASSWHTIGPEFTAERKRNNITHPTSENVTEKFSFISSNSGHRECKFSTIAAGSGSLQRNDKELNHQESLFTEQFARETTVAPTEQSVSMRDIGTEMTPIPSPLDSLTPSRSPMTSMPSTPSRGPSALLTAEAAPGNLDTKTEGGTSQLSEKELQLRTRREIVALGIQLGKTNIATWASKEDTVQSSPKTHDVDHKKIEYETRAAAWEEAENCKHNARFRREEVRIQAWESHKKAKIEAEMKRIEAKAETMKEAAAKKASEQLSRVQQQVEHREAASHAQMMKDAAHVAHKADRIRRTGRLPSSSYLCCFMFL